MFTVQRLGEKIEGLASSHASIDEFQEWFLSESWGFYDINGDDLSGAIAAVHHVFFAYEADEIEECALPRELAAAIRPFENRDRHLALIPSSLDKRLAKREG